MIEKNEPKFTLDTIWAIFKNKVALATISVFLIIAGSLLKQKSQTKMVTLKTNQYAELLSLDSSIENLKFGEDWP